MGIGSVEHPCDHAVISLVDWAGRTFATHGAIDGFDGELAGVGGGVFLPPAYLSLARLPGGEADVHGLLDRLVDNLGGESQQSSDASGLGRTEVRDVVDLMFVERDTLHEINLNLVSGGDAAQQIVAGTIHRLGNRKNRRDVVTGVGEVRGEKRIVHVELADSGAIRPGPPFRTDAMIGWDTEYSGPSALRAPFP